DCASYAKNEFPHRDFVLVCTSDGRETGKLDDRSQFLDRVRNLALGRPVIFKLHPNEIVARAEADIAEAFPQAFVSADASAEQMAAICEAVISEWPSLPLVGWPLGKGLPPDFDWHYPGGRLPIQNRGPPPKLTAREGLEVLREVEPGRRAVLDPLQP